MASLDHPAFMGLPVFAVRLALGELAREWPRTSTRVLAAKPLASGVLFRYPQLDWAIADLVGEHRLPCV